MVWMLESIVHPELDENLSYEPNLDGFRIQSCFALSCFTLMKRLENRACFPCYANEWPSVVALCPMTQMQNWKECHNMFVIRPFCPYCPFFFSTVFFCFSLIFEDRPEPESGKYPAYIRRGPAYIRRLLVRFCSWQNVLPSMCGHFTFLWRDYSRLKTVYRLFKRLVHGQNDL